MIAAEPRAPHEHDWKPVPGYTGRYRCSGCQAFGYKARVVTSYGRNDPITPYKCKVCGGWAVAKDGISPVRLGRKQWRCARHRRGQV